MAGAEPWGLAADTDQARHWFEAAARAGHGRAMEKLVGLPRDLLRARELYAGILRENAAGRSGWDLEERFIAFQRSRFEVVERLLSVSEQ